MVWRRVRESLQQVLCLCLSYKARFGAMSKIHASVILTNIRCGMGKREAYLIFVPLTGDLLCGTTPKTPDYNRPNLKCVKASDSVLCSAYSVGRLSCIDRLMLSAIQTALQSSYLTQSTATIGEANVLMFWCGGVGSGRELCCSSLMKDGGNVLKRIQIM